MRDLHDGCVASIGEWQVVLYATLECTPERPLPGRGSLVELLIRWIVIY
jgi:hypothetical protein